MQNSSKPKFMIPVVASVERVPNRDDVTGMIEALFDVLERHQADSDEGVLALLTSFVQGSSRILEFSPAENVEHNRKSLLAMLEQARRTIDMWTVGGPPSDYVH
jgi:hypothetical protein